MSGLRHAAGNVTRGSGSGAGQGTTTAAVAAVLAGSEPAACIAAVAVGQHLVLALRRRGGEAGVGDVLVAMSLGKVLVAKASEGATPLGDAVVASLAVDALSTEASARVVSVAASTGKVAVLCVGLDDGTVTTLLVGNDGNLTHLATTKLADSPITAIAVDATEGDADSAAAGRAMTANLVAGSSGGDLFQMGLTIGDLGDAAVTASTTPVETVKGGLKAEGEAEAEAEGAACATIEESGGGAGCGGGSICALSTSTDPSTATRHVCAVDEGGRMYSWCASAVAESFDAKLALLVRGGPVHALPTAPGWFLGTSSGDRTVRLWTTPPGPPPPLGGASEDEGVARSSKLLLHHTFDTAGSVSGLAVHTSSFPRSTKVALVMHGKLELWDFIHNRNPVTIGALLGCQ